MKISYKCSEKKKKTKLYNSFRWRWLGKSLQAARGI